MAASNPPMVECTVAIGTPAAKFKKSESISDTRLLNLYRKYGTFKRIRKGKQLKNHQVRWSTYCVTLTLENIYYGSLENHPLTSQLYTFSLVFLKANIFLV